MQAILGSPGESSAGLVIASTRLLDHFMVMDSWPKLKPAVSSGELVIMEQSRLHVTGCTFGTCLGNETAPSIVLYATMLS